MSEPGKPASEGQKNYIAQLMRLRVQNPVVCGDVDRSLYPVPHLDFRDACPVETWIAQLTFVEAKDALTYLVTLPEPPPPEKSEISSAQRSKCWAILKTLGCNTYRAWLLRKDDPDIPHLRWDDTDTSVWDWLSGLSVAEANDVIEHLEEVQKIVRR